MEDTDTTKLLTSFLSPSATTASNDVSGNTSAFSNVLTGINALTNLNNSLKGDNKTVTTAPATITANYNLPGDFSKLTDTSTEDSLKSASSWNASLGISQNDTATAKNNNVLLYVGIGVAVVIIGIVLYFSFKKR